MNTQARLRSWAMCSAVFAAVALPATGCTNQGPGNGGGKGFGDPTGTFSTAVGWQSVGKPHSASPGDEFFATAETAVVLRGGKSVKVPCKTGVGDAWNEWEAVLVEGHASVDGGADPANPGSFVSLDAGLVYVSSQYRETPPPPPPPPKGGPNAEGMGEMALVEAVPVVVRKGPVGAGSVGTHWLVWSNGDQAASPKTIVVLLPDPGKATGGKVTVWQKMADGSVRKAELVDPRTYVEIPGNQLPASPRIRKLADLPNGSDLLELERKALQAANWKQGLSNP